VEGGLVDGIESRVVNVRVLFARENAYVEFVELYLYMFLVLTVY
jgi:hypothetical protein